MEENQSGSPTTTTDENDRRANMAKDIKLYSHLEDIHDLSSMFVECSFVLARNESSN